jgi:HSP20 family protein
LLTPISTKVVDIDGGFTVRAQIPGFTRKDIEVQAEPRRLIIYGKKQGRSERQEGRGVLKGKVPDEIFRVLDLPHEIDPDDVRATIKNGVLEITLRMWRRIFEVVRRRTVTATACTWSLEEVWKNE